MSAIRWVSGVVAAALAAGTAISVIALRDTRQHTASLEAESRLVATGRGDMEYMVWGAGPPVLVVHGAGGGFDQGRLLARNLGPSGVTWISVSRFGYLRSQLPEARTPADQAQAFADLLDALDVGQVRILAMSGGVPPALHFSERHPDRVAGMVLLSPAPFTPFGPDVEDRPIPDWVYGAMLGNDIVYWLLTRFARGGLEQAFDARPDLKKGIAAEEAAFVDDLIDGFLPASRRVEGVNNERAAVCPDMVYRLEDIKAPTLLIHARDDRLNPFAVAQAIADRLPNARLIAFERGGHLLLGHHAEIRRLTDAFLSNPGPREGD